MSLLEKLIFFKNNGVKMNIIAKLSNCSLPTISNWIAGRDEPSIHLQRSIEIGVEKFLKKMKEVM